MFSLDIHYVKYDMVQYGTILLLASLINYYFKGTELFNEQWNNVAMITLFAVLISNLFITKLIKYIHTKFEIKNTLIQDSISDFFKFGTIFLFSQIVKNYFNNKTYLNKETFYIFIFTLLGFMIFNMINPLLPIIEYKKQVILDDILKISLGIICTGIFVDKKFNKKHAIELFIISISIITFHYGTKNILSETTINKVEGAYPNRLVIPPAIIE